MNADDKISKETYGHWKSGMKKEETYIFSDALDKIDLWILHDLLFYEDKASSMYAGTVEKRNKNNIR